MSTPTPTPATPDPAETPVDSGQTVVHELTAQQVAQLVRPGGGQLTMYVDPPERALVDLTVGPTHSDGTTETCLQLTWPDGTQTREDWDVLVVPRGARVRIGDEA